MKKLLYLVLAACVVSLCFSANGWTQRKTTIKVGINAPMTGDIPKVGEGTKYAAEMWLEDVNKAGGIEVGGKKYPVEIVLEDNESKAADLYDGASDYPKGWAEFFKAAWEEKHGPGSVVAYESFTTKDTDFSSQLTKIIKSDAEFLFTPQYYNEVALIVNQAKDLGWKGPIVGSDSWGSAETVELCGEACFGQFFSTHYAAAGAQGATKEFIDRYNAKYGYVPDDVGALTWDALPLAQAAIEGAGELTGDIKKDRTAVRDALAKIENFEGITGTMTFTEEGDPNKCAVIVRISDKGEYEFYKSICP